MSGGELDKEMGKDDVDWGRNVGKTTTVKESRALQVIQWVLRAGVKRLGGWVDLETVEQGSVTKAWGGQPGFISTVSRAIPIHLHSVCGSSVATMAEVSSCHRDCFTCRAQNVYYLDFYRKSLPAAATDTKQSTMILESHSKESTLLRGAMARSRKDVKQWNDMVIRSVF